MYSIVFQTSSIYCACVRSLHLYFITAHLGVGWEFVSTHLLTRHRQRICKARFFSSCNVLRKSFDMVNDSVVFSLVLFLT